MFDEAQLSTRVVYRATLSTMILRLLAAAVLTLIALALWASTTAQKTIAPSELTPAQAAADLPAEASAQAGTHMVTRVLDGDTIILAGGQKVRYIGIDSPELYGGQDAECFAEESLAKNRELVLGKRVRLESDTSENDQYGRLLRYVYIDDTFINETLVRGGFARTRAHPPDTTLQSTLHSAEMSAKAEKTGLWADGACK